MNSGSPLTRLPKPKAVLVDLDDTILSFRAGAGPCWERVCATYAPRLDLSAEALLDAIDERRTWFWSDPARHRTGRLDLARTHRENVEAALVRLHRDAPALAAKASVAAEIAEAYGRDREDSVTLLPGAIPALHQLRAQGLALALVTNGETAGQWRKIRRFELAPLFDTILVEQEVGYGKPDERVFTLALERLGVEAREAWMVGDNPVWDVFGPQRLGITGVWIDASGEGLRETGAERPALIIRSLAELPEAIARSGKG